MMKNRISIAVSIVSALIYISMEVIYRALTHQMDTYPYAAMMGYTSLHMGWVAAISVWLMGKVADGTPRKTLTWMLKALKAAMLALGIEFISGLILNVWLGFGIWDYSQEPLNIMGQVCPQFALYWLLITPFALWLDDTVSVSAPIAPKLRRYYLYTFFWWTMNTTEVQQPIEVPVVDVESDKPTTFKMN